MHYFTLGTQPRMASLPRYFIAHRQCGNETPPNCAQHIPRVRFRSLPHGHTIHILTHLLHHNDATCCDSGPYETFPSAHHRLVHSTVVGMASERACAQITRINFNYKMRAGSSSIRPASQRASSAALLLGVQLVCLALMSDGQCSLHIYYLHIQGLQRLPRTVTSM